MENNKVCKGRVYYVLVLPCTLHYFVPSCTTLPCPTVYDLALPCTLHCCVQPCTTLYLALYLALLCTTLHHFVPCTTLYRPVLCTTLHHLVPCITVHYLVPCITVHYVAPPWALHYCAQPCTTLNLAHCILTCTAYMHCCILPCTTLHMAFRWHPAVVDNTGEGRGKGNLEDAWTQTWSQSRSCGWLNAGLM